MAKISESGHGYDVIDFLPSVVSRMRRSILIRMICLPTKLIIKVTGQPVLRQPLSRAPSTCIKRTHDQCPCKSRPTLRGPIYFMITPPFELLSLAWPRINSLIDLSRSLLHFAYSPSHFSLAFYSIILSCPYRP